MVVMQSRSSWTSKPPRVPLADLVAHEVEGVAIHWPGTTGPIGDPGTKKTAARLEGYRQYHVQFHKWSDIAYNYAVDQGGRVWILRGPTKRSAANGDEKVNRTHVAILALVGPGEEPTPAMIAGIRAARADIIRHFPKATAVVGHKDIRPEPTDCPGKALTGLIRRGAFNTAPAQAKPAHKFVLKRELRIGATGADVEALQRSLNRMRTADIRVDGDFGPITKKAVIAVQRRKWPLLPSRWDGIVGPLTATKILGWEFA